jgi:spermidine/putrescine transport system permease protein
MKLFPRTLLFLLVAAGPVFLVLVPLGGFVLNSFYGMSGGQIVRNMSLANYAEFLTNWTYLGVLLGTIWLGVRVAAICLLFAYPLAWFVWQQPDQRRFPMLLVLSLPLFMSYIVKLFTMRSLLSVKGLVNTVLVGSGILSEPTSALMFNQNAILLTMVVMYLPFVILPIYLSLERIAPSLIQASADLGGTQGNTFRHIVWPLSLPGVVSGTVFAFVLTMGDYITPQLVGGPNGFTFGRIVFSQFGAAYNWPLGAALAVILLLVSAVAMVIASFASRPKGAH